MSRAHTAAGVASVLGESTVTPETSGSCGEQLPPGDDAQASWQLCPWHGRPLDRWVQVPTREGGVILWAPGCWDHLPRPPDQESPQ